MATIGTVLSVAHSLYSALNSPVVKAVCSTLGYKSHLEDLEKTVTTVQSVLLDAAASEELNNAARDYIEKLKAAVYDADDLFDEFRTLPERKQQLKDSKLSEKVRRFLSSENPLKVVYQMSKEIKKIGKNLDGIARDHTNFRFAIDSKHIRNRRQETSSFVFAPNVIGREADVEGIVDNLLDLNGKKGARYLTVVGIGGMGKTTLAQLVCANQRVKDWFYSNVWWVCVADQDNSQFDMKTILSKMLESVTDSNGHCNSSLEVVQKKLGQELEGKKYLLVLDDVWNKDRVKWMELTDFLTLTLGVAESRIMVTTRSHDVANAIGNSNVHVLKGLSDENSWRLFEKTAFEQKPDSQVHALEVEIGKKIVRDHTNFGFAVDSRRIRYRRQETCSYVNKPNVIGREVDVELIVGKLLDLNGKRGARFLAVVGMGGMGKTTLAQLVCDDQMVKERFSSNVWWVCVADEKNNPFDMKTILSKMLESVTRSNRHRDSSLEVVQKELGEELEGKKYLLVLDDVWNEDRVKWKELTDFLTIGAAECRILVTLTLVNVGMKTLPDSIGKLLHLRYLDLSDNEELKTLPGSITKLHNLQTLKLRGCEELRELPKKFRRLVNLMHLNIKECDRIEYMPVGMDKLTSLCELTNFVVADESSSGDNQVGQLKDLKSLAVNLKGSIRIKMLYNSQGANLYDWEGSCFNGAEHLQAVHFNLGHGVDAKDEALLEKLLPHRNIKELVLSNYSSVRTPRWGRGGDYNWAAIFPNLVRIQIGFCLKLKHLPMLSILKYLKSLGLYSLDELEYIDDETSWSSSCGSSTGAESKEEAECTLFPSLESLTIRDVRKLKGIFKGVEFGGSRSNNNARLWPTSSFPRLIKLDMEAENLKTRGMQYLMTSLERLSIRECGNMEALPEWIGMHCLSSLRRLNIHDCKKLKSIPKGVRNMTSLKRLCISGWSDELERRCQEPHGEDWPIIKHIPNIHIRPYSKI